MASYRQIGRDDGTDLQKKLNQKQGELTPKTGYSVTSTAGGKEQNTQTSPAPAPGGYQESETVRQAQQMLQDHMANKPGAYQSTWQSQMDEILGKILNREDFSYDLNGDALYQQYKDQYVLRGQQAMMDTMGQAAALTGGYGNSYAQNVGQQAYQGHLQQLNDRIPELYQLALSKYQMDGQRLADQYAMIGARDEQDYGRYRDSVSDYYSELDRLTDTYRDERSYDYGRYADERDYAYGQERDKVADEQWQAEFDEAKRRYDQEWEQKYGSGSSGGSSGGGSGSGGSGGSSGGSSGGNGNGDEPLIGSQQRHEEQMAALAAQNASTGKVQNFMESLHPESQHDAIMRDKWGSYRQYVAYQIEHANLTDAEKAYLISRYGIRESDTDYKN